MRLRSYSLVRRLGRGGDGDVWLATTPRGDEVALKALSRLGGLQEQRLRSEYERLRTLHLPHVIRVLDVDSDQGFVFFTMDVARGLPFDRYVRKAGSLSERVQRAAGAGSQVVRALAEIHRLGLAHGDIKPDNILVDQDGTATLLDFGTVRAGQSKDTHTILGTLAYLAPEQRMGRLHDSRVDVYALGVTLHEAISQVAANPRATAAARPPLALLGPQVPLALSDLVQRLLAMDPADRPLADETLGVLGGIARNEAQPPAPWPAFYTFQGDSSNLLDQNCMVVGQAGTGRRRLIEEARWHWHRRGYRSITGRCRPDQPFSALR
ncbi:MAG: serine/threonine-protein kinase, partial [Myxococcota bacterium]|nr:serine/threonine-protein kinase [Myxococcota bacterium]